MTILSNRDKLVEIAHLYYEEGLTQQQISRRMNMSRSLVSKMLGKARSTGIVEVTIHSEICNPHKEAEDRLRQILDLKQIKIIDAYSSGNDGTMTPFHKEVARYLSSIFLDCKTVAVSASSNIYAAAKQMSTTVSYPHMVFVPASGGLAELGWESNANSNCSLLAEKLGAKAQQLYAPIVVESRETKDVLCAQPFIRKVLENGRAADLALVGVGGTFNRFSLIEDYAEELNFNYTIDPSQVCGDVSFNYFDRNGQPVDCEWNRMMMGLTLSDFQKIPDVICIASEDEKAESIYIAARHKLFTSLIITDTLARRINEIYTRELYRSR